MKRRYSFITGALVLIAGTLFLWMFFAAATLERTADLGGIAASTGQDARALAFEFAARWRHGMAGNSPLYMPGFFAVALAVWFWCDRKKVPRMLAEGVILIFTASACAALLAPLAAPRMLHGFVKQQEGLAVSHAKSSGTWVASAQGIYSLLTWSTVIIASRFAVRLRSFKPLLVPLTLNLILAFVRPWTVADFTSQWVRQAFAGETVALFSLLVVPILSGLLAWTELRSPRKMPWLVRLTS